MFVSPIRLVLKDEASRGKVTNFVWKKGWTLHDFKPGSDQEPYEYIWYPRDRKKTFIHYVEDPWVGARYIALMGEDREPVIEQIRAALPTYGREEFLLHLKEAKSPEELARWVDLAGVAAVPDTFDPEVFARFQAAAHHPDPNVRAEVTRAAVFAAWREFKGLLEELRTQDSEEEVRRRADIALQALMRNNWQEG
ncbi:HEAT repeat domain-containing protein [Corallococcus interemptor]|uniref:HEAT repeat domain-containing protein n=1 Tax=Corallococcus interemptor TaxID=2316720 RepID=UPI003CFEB98E